MIRESERRWPDWSEGQFIELPDGQQWSFYEPSPAMYDGMPGWSFGADVSADLNAELSRRLGCIIAKWGKATTDTDRAASILEAGWFLLARNYYLTRAEFAQIMLKAATWTEAQHERFSQHLLVLIGYACHQATTLAESA